MTKWFGSLKPPTDRSNVVANPFKLLSSISLQGYLFIISGWIAWTVDGQDYFAVSLVLTRLATQFGKTTTQMTTAITLTLLFRSLGAVIFGLLSDRFGRKYTLIANLLICAVFQLGSSFCNSYGAFLGVRCIFGIAMGGIWGQASATALENVPVEARGLVSGFLQQGYAVGYLISAVINLTVVPKNPHTWRALFWINTGTTVFAALIRLMLPESPIYVQAKEEAKARGEDSSGKSKAFMKELGNMLKEHWLKCIWAVLLMTGFNFLSHGSQDLYVDLSSKATIIANCGAFCGGIIAGYVSQFTGRRLGILIFLCWTAAFIPLWILPSSFGSLSAGAFFLQFGVQGAWGIIPIFLAESSPPAFRSSFGGIAYQLGNMVSSAASQIESRAGENLPLKKNGAIVISSTTHKAIPDYAKVQGILIGVVIAWTAWWTIVGPENHGAHFEEGKVAFQAGAGKEDAAELIEPHGVGRNDIERQHELGSDMVGEKTMHENEHVEAEKAVV